jgi:hypothetical protein
MDVTLYEYQSLEFLNPRDRRATQLFVRKPVQSLDLLLKESLKFVRY